MEGWTRSEILGLIALLISLIAALAGVVVIQSKFWRNTLIVCVCLVTVVSGGLLIAANLKTDVRPVLTDDETLKKEYLRKNITGMWYNPNEKNTQIFEFTDYGDVIFSRGPKDKRVSTYRIIDSAHIEVKFTERNDISRIGERVIFDVDLNQETLILTADPKNQISNSANANQGANQQGPVTIGLTRLPLYLKIIIFFDR